MHFRSHIWQHIFPSSDNADLSRNSLYAHVNILLIIIDICYVLLRGTYKNILKRSFVREIESVLVHNIVMWGVVMAYLYVTKQAFWFSRQVFLTSFGFTVIFMLVGRFCGK